MKNQQSKLRLLHDRRGMALMLVIPAVAVAAVLSYAVLANVGTQDQISANAELMGRTDALSESGVNYAMYQLQRTVNSQSMPPVNFESSITSGNIRETFTVSATSTQAGPDMVISSITSTGTTTRIDGDNHAVGSSLSRTLNLKVQIPLGPSSSQGAGGNLWQNGSGTGPTQTGGAYSSLSGLSPTPDVPKNIRVLGWSQ